LKKEYTGDRKKRGRRIRVAYLFPGGINSSLKEIYAPQTFNVQ